MAHRSETRTKDILNKMSKSFDKKRIFYLFMTLLTAIIIFYASAIETTAGVKTGINLATIYHLVVFFMFSFFLLLTIKSNKIDNKTIIIAILISIIYALSDEFHQLFVPGRFSSIKDVLIDCAGSLCAIFLISKVEKFNKH